MSKELPKVANDFLNYLLFIRNKSEGTVRVYGNDLRLLFQYLKYDKELRDKYKPENIKNIDIDKIDEDFIRNITLSDLNNFLTYTNKFRNNGACAIAKKIATIKSFYKYLENNDIIQKNIARRLESVTIPKRNPVSLTLEQTKTLLNTARSMDDKFSTRNIAILTIFATTGIRLSELRGLDLDNINLEYKTISVVGKGNKERNVPIKDVGIQALNEYLEFRKTIEVDIAPEDKKAIFISSKYNRISKNGIHNIIKNYIRSAGLDDTKFSTHSLRHGVATLLHKYGKVDIRTLQEILGHKNISTTQIYTHVDDEQIQDALNTLPDF